MTDSNKFTEWVMKHNIGPSMNDVWRNQRNPDQPPIQNYSGFDGDVGDGWLPILDRLATDLIAMGWDRDLAQVKEKFGTLRFYIGHGTEEMHVRIHKAEEESAVTCETCGAPGTLRGKAWVYTACDAHTQPKDRVP